MTMPLLNNKCHSAGLIYTELGGGNTGCGKKYSGPCGVGGGGVTIIWKVHCALWPQPSLIVTVTASDGCGQSAQCTFQIIVTPPPPTPQGPEYFFPQPVLPPPNSVYISPALWHLLFNNGIVIRDVRHRFFTQTYPLPPLGSSQMETFSSELDFDL